MSSSRRSTTSSEGTAEALLRLSASNCGGLSPGCWPPPLLLQQVMVVNLTEPSTCTLFRPAGLRRSMASVQSPGEERGNVPAQLTALASEPCHCPGVGKPMAQMTQADAASAEAFNGASGHVGRRRRDHQRRLSHEDAAVDGLSAWREPRWRRPWGAICHPIHLP